MAGANIFDSQGRSLLSLPAAANPDKSDRVMAMVVVDIQGNPVDWSTLGGGGGTPGEPSLGYFIYTQATPSDTWVITHNMKRFPHVVVVDEDGVEGVPDVDYHLDNITLATFTLTVRLSNPIAGKAILS